MTFEMLKNGIRNKQPSRKENFLWNMIGSGVYSASSMVLSLIVIKIVGANQGGVFSIALTLSQMLVYLAYFEMRTFLVTDTKNEFSFSEYHAAKILLCILMIFVSVLYTIVNSYDLEKRIIILLVCFVRFLDGYADVYEAQFQRDGRLDLAGKSLAYRTIIFVLVLVICLFMNGDLILSLVVSDFAAILGVIIFDVWIMNVLDKVTCSWNFQKIKGILTACFPLFVGVFCWTYILSASRIAIDGNMSSEYQAYYQVIFMPVSVINLFAGFVFRPMLPTLSNDYNNGRYSKVKKMLYKGIVGMVIFTGICMCVAYLVGIPVLSLLSGCDLSEYQEVLVFLIFAGGFNAIAFTMYYVLTIMRRPISILIDYILAAILAFVLSPIFVRMYGINGAAGSYFIVVLVLCMLFSISIVKVCIKIKKDKRVSK